MERCQDLLFWRDVIFGIHTLVYYMVEFAKAALDRGDLLHWIAKVSEGRSNLSYKLLERF